MKTLFKPLLIVVISFFSFQAFSQANKQFYKAISGTYLDERSGEIVYLILADIGGVEPFKMYYQLNEQQAPKKAKMMKELTKDINRLWIKVKFHQSNYICEFTFAPDFDTFTCKNPDGSTQVFKRNMLPARKPFSYFLAHFPKAPLQQPVDITKMTKKGKPIPIEWAIKFIINQNENLSNDLLPENKSAFTQTQKMDYKRRMILDKLLNGQGFRSISFYYIGQVFLSNQFSSVLFRVSGHPHYEAASDDIYLANFTKSGELLGVASISYVMFNYVYSSTEAKGTISKNKISIEAITKYGKVAQAMIATEKGEKMGEVLQEQEIIRYTIAPSGQIKRQQRFFKGFPGKFYDKIGFPTCWLTKIKGEFEAMILTIENEEDKGKETKLKFVKLEPAQRLLHMNNPKDDQIWKFQFNETKTSLKIIKPDGTFLMLKR
ncbi:MAG TPA: hypothetical protein DCS93_26600 [Microscillaceae bacterium]|nr:hypothetical protein [Microscillaceae bacterium]